MAMSSHHLSALLSEVQSTISVGQGDIVQGAYEAIDAAGFEAGALSGNPIAIFDKFMRETLGPFLEEKKGEFSKLVVRTIATFAKEDFCGPNSAKVFIAVGVADALQKILPPAFAGQYDFSVLTNTDWTMLAFGVMLTWSFLQPPPESL